MGRRIKTGILFFAVLLMSGRVLAAKEGAYENVQWNAGEINSEGYFTSRDTDYTPFNIDGRVKPGRKMLTDKKAIDYVGDAREKFVDKDYYFEGYKRVEMDPRYNRMYDYMIFVHEKGRMGHKSRKSGSHEIIVSDPVGVFMQRVTPPRWPKIENTLLDDKLKPYVIFDTEGNEAAIIYIGKGAYVRQKFNRDGLILLRITMN